MIKKLAMDAIKMLRKMLPFLVKQMNSDKNGDDDPDNNVVSLLEFLSFVLTNHLPAPPTILP